MVSGKEEIPEKSASLKNCDHFKTSQNCKSCKKHLLSSKAVFSLKNSHFAFWVCSSLRLESRTQSKNE